MGAILFKLSKNSFIKKDQTLPWASFGRPAGYFVSRTTALSRRQSTKLDSFCKGNMMHAADGPAIWNCCSLEKTVEHWVCFGIRWKPKENLFFSLNTDNLLWYKSKYFVQNLKWWNIFLYILWIPTILCVLFICVAPLRIYFKLNVSSHSLTVALCTPLFTCSRSWKHCWPSWRGSPPWPHHWVHPRWIPTWGHHKKSPVGRAKRCIAQDHRGNTDSTSACLFTTMPAISFIIYF